MMACARGPDSGPTMEKGVNHDRIAAWRWVASILIYPVTILPGLNATILADLQRLRRARLLELGGCVEQHVARFPRGGRNRRTLVLDTHSHRLDRAEPLALLARHDGPDDGLAHGGPVLEGGYPEPGHTPAQVRLSRTLGVWRSTAGRLRQPHTADLGQVSPVQACYSGPGPVRPASSSGGQSGVLRPVRLELYRPPAPMRWWVPSERIDNRVDRV